MSSLQLQNALCLLKADGSWTAERRSLAITNGAIASLDSGADYSDGAVEYVDAAGLLAVPGFINAHCHSPDNLARGSAPDLPLELWSLSSSAARESRSAREIYLSVLLGAIEMMGSGTTTVLDHVKISPDIDDDSLDAVASAWRDSGMRVTIAPVVSDRAVVGTMPFKAGDFDGADLSTYGARTPLSARDQIASVERFYCRWNGAGEGRIRVAIGPSAPQRCSDELLVMAADFSARHEMPLHMHVLETELQRHMSHRLYGCGAIAHLESLGLLTPCTNLVHCIWIDDGDIGRIARCGASVIHNPVSNARLGSGTCRVPEIINAGITIGLGTDSACCNDGSNMLETMKWAAIVHNCGTTNEADWLGPQRALTLATEGSAKAIGLHAMAGKIEPGYRADLALFRLASAPFVPLNDAVRQLVLSETGASHALTICNGQIIARNGAPVLFDQATIWAETQELADRRKRDNASAFHATHQLEIPIRRMRQRLVGGCVCH
ncbi:amidohydrolase family protein [Rhizobium sp. GR12]|uniref:amidohydrolase family protein n=1 Tax=Rhizobium sp. GR12 TaxID=3053925 RepID=UPI002FBE8325